MQNIPGVETWYAKRILYQTKVATVALYACEMWSPNMSHTAWGRFENQTKTLIQKEFGVCRTVPYTIMILEAGLLPFEISAWKQTMQYLLNTFLKTTDKLAQAAIVDSDQLAKTPYHGWYFHLAQWTYHLGINFDDVLNSMDGFQERWIQTAIATWLNRSAGTKLAIYATLLNSNRQLGQDLYQYCRPGTRKMIATYRMGLHRLHVCASFCKALDEHKRKIWLITLQYWVAAFRENLRKDLTQKPSRKGRLPSAIAAKVRAKKLPPSWVNRIIPLPKVFDVVHDNALVVSASTKEEVRKDLESNSDTVAAAKVDSLRETRVKLI
ncbi:hypothetical protein SELMODRAFT_428222 [Selaginella moellendorffii]|uniref:Uncharacterized protein n=1 Tax=Selaginella moellendorffii TaxID=88036 RepID=D8T250_SELML|nr:hypothetical protein SELMODRAFT_428222 [Selaginella moellendorffii]